MSIGIVLGHILLLVALFSKWNCWTNIWQGEFFSQQCNAVTNIDLAKTTRWYLDHFSDTDLRLHYKPTRFSVSVISYAQRWYQKPSQAIKIRAFEYRGICDDPPDLDCKYYHQCVHADNQSAKFSRRKIPGAVATNNLIIPDQDFLLVQSTDQCNFQCDQF